MATETRQAWIDSVRQAVDIVEVVGRHVPLKRKGRHWWGLCPFHGEKTPSFSVDGDQQLFYCFGCQKGGTVFTFLMSLEGREFKEVIESLAQEVGIPQPDESGVGRADPHQRLRAVLEWTQEYFVDQFRKSRAIVEPYLESRGVALHLIDRFMMGFAPDSWHGLKEVLERRGVTLNEMVDAGVVIRREQGGGYDRWRGRLIFPIWDRQGRIVAFGGRALKPDQDPKYLNSPDTSLFNKGQLLYGAHLARPGWRKGVPALIVEGYFDVLALHQAGQTQAVGQLGTALTDGQARYLARYVNTVDLLLDQDAAGQAAMRRAFLILSGANLKVNVISLPDGVKDPSELVKAHGIEVLVEAVSERRPYLEREINAASYATGTLSPRRQAEIVDDFRPLIRAVKDPVEQAGYLEMLAKSLRVHPQILSQSLWSTQEGRHTIGKNRHNMGVTAPSRRSQPTEIWLLAALKRHPDQIERVKAALPEWSSQMRIQKILEDFLTRASAEGPTPVSDDQELEALYAAIGHNDGPDGGTQAIDDFIWAMQREIARHRYDEIKELIRQGQSDPELMEEVRQLGGRLEPYQDRKEG